MAGCGSFQSTVLSTSLKQSLEGSSQGLQCRGDLEASGSGWRGFVSVCGLRLGGEGGRGGELFIYLVL